MIVFWRDHFRSFPAIGRAVVSVTRTANCTSSDEPSGSDYALEAQGVNRVRRRPAGSPSEERVVRGEPHPPGREFPPEPRMHAIPEQAADYLARSMAAL
jgi:hypothetical protein